jgi:hypothetical protein
LYRQRNLETCHARLRREIEPPGMVVDHCIGNMQPQAGSQPGWLGGEELFEHPLLDLERDARAIVLISTIALVPLRRVGW